MGKDSAGLLTAGKNYRISRADKEWAMVSEKSEIEKAIASLGPMRSPPRGLDTLRPHYDRLQASHKAAIQEPSWDKLWDLSAHLQIWVETAQGMASTSHPIVTMPDYPTSRPRGSLRKDLAQSEFILATFPGAVITFGHRGDMFATADQDDWVAYQSVMMDEREAFHCRWFCFEKGMKEDRVWDNAFIERRTTLEPWLSGTCVWLRRNEGRLGQDIEISRSELIERVANSHDGRHQSLNTNVSGRRAKLTVEVQFLMGVVVLGLPLPYILLVKFAQDLLASLSPKLS